MACVLPELRRAFLVTITFIPHAHRNRCDITNVEAVKEFVLINRVRLVRRPWMSGFSVLRNLLAHIAIRCRVDLLRSIRDKSHLILTASSGRGRFFILRMWRAKDEILDKRAGILEPRTRANSYNDTYFGGKLERPKS